MDYWDNTSFTNVEAILRPMHSKQTNATSDESNYWNVIDNITDSALSGFVIDIILICVVNIVLFGFGEEMTVFKNQFKKINFDFLIAATVLLFSLPIISLTLFGAWIYKTLSKVIIMMYDPLFLFYLESTDVFWCLNEDITKSYIHACGTIAVENCEELAIRIRNKLRDEFQTENGIKNKIFYEKAYALGFFYWRYNYNISFVDYVEVVRAKEVRQFLAEVSSESLESNVMFKIFLIENNNLNADVVFKVHHSVGDGYALFRFLNILLNDEATVVVDKKVKSDSCYQLTPNVVKEIIYCLISSIIRKPDENVLHVNELQGRSIFAWIETEVDFLNSLKRIKKSGQNITITDVLLQSLAKSLTKYLLKKKYCKTDNLSVIVPTRLSNEVSGNNFGINLMDLGLNQTYLKLTSDNDSRIRRKADLLMNYLFVKTTCAVLPRCVLEPLLMSRHATLAFSNVPGPEETLSICGSELKSLVFFVPNKGTTGLGVTVLSYGGVLRFATMADSAVIDRNEDLEEILRGLVEDVEIMARALHNGNRQHGM